MGPTAHVQEHDVSKGGEPIRELQEPVDITAPGQTLCAVGLWKPGVATPTTSGVVAAPRKKRVTPVVKKRKVVPMGELTDTQPLIVSEDEEEGVAGVSTNSTEEEEEEEEKSILAAVAPPGKKLKKVTATEVDSGDATRGSEESDYETVDENSCFDEESSGGDDDVFEQAYMEDAEREQHLAEDDTPSSVALQITKHFIKMVVWEVLRRCLRGRQHCDVGVWRREFLNAREVVARRGTSRGSSGAEEVHDP
ncbi:predicted protein [Nematostella vectensis]|uniref:Uncharacterized protein n=1 Tax=Nematostella vectensis TaxID=45351 RepID=A7RFJ8_NEMVE|nr:predicted protein [Nematostella vectensis]|eukprot:XP_001641675.1 predicted protein [Nematostella vectensis]